MNKKTLIIISIVLLAIFIFQVFLRYKVEIYTSSKKAYIARYDKLTGKLDVIQSEQYKKRKKKQKEEEERLRSLVEEQSEEQEKAILKKKGLL